MKLLQRKTTTIQENQNNEAIGLYESALEKYSNGDMQITYLDWKN
jgi:hypothetical protein